MEDINDLQEMVGYYQEVTGAAHGFRLDQHGTFTILDFPGVTRTQAFGINRDGQLVGTFIPEGQGPHGWFYDRNMFIIPDPPETQNFVSAMGINDAQAIVGQINSVTGRHGFLYADSVFTPIDVPFPGATDTQVHGINNQGAMVGTYLTVTGRHGFLRQPDGTFTPIDAPFAGAFGTIANGLNDQGVIVGQYSDQSGTHGFLYEQGTYTIIDVPGSVGTAVNGINTQGRLVGTYAEPANIQHGFVAK